MKWPTESPLRKYTTLVGVLAALAAVLGAAGIRWLLDPVLGDQLPYVTFLIAAALVAWRTGTGPTVLAIVLGWWCGQFFFLQPRLTWYPQGLAAPNVVVTVGYFALGATIICFSHRAQSALRRSEALTQTSASNAAATARLAAIVESSDDGIISKDLNGVITSWNAGAQRLFGYTAAEAIGHSVTMLIPPDRVDEEPDILARIRRGEGVDHYETVRRRKDGKLIHISLTVSPLRDRDGTIVGASKIVRDITARKQAELALRDSELQARRALVEAENASRAKDEFLAMLSHELRTPMSAIVGWARMLKAGLSPEETRQGIEVIERNARLQSQIIEDLLDMSRVLSGKFRLDVQTLDVPTVLGAAVDSIRFAASAKGLQLKVTSEAGCGEIRGDPSRLQQVFFNLLSNATKFTPSGGRIEVSCQRVGSLMEVRITDTGVGIRPDFLPRVFDRFQQQDSQSTRQHHGLGLGLAIVKHLVELHGGTVHAASAGEGQGATFSVYLPVSLALTPQGVPPWGERAELTHPVRTDADEADARALAGLTVLVTDDEADARAMLKTMLERRGAKVLLSGSALDAIDRLQRHLPDVLLCDIGMPGMDGYGLITRVRSSPPDKGGAIPAIALTAFARSEDRTRSLLAGFQMHLSKPVEPEELVASIRSVAALS